MEEYKTVGEGGNFLKEASLLPPHPYPPKKLSQKGFWGVFLFWKRTGSVVRKIEFFVGALHETPENIGIFAC